MNINNNNLDRSLDEIISFRKRAGAFRGRRGGRVRAIPGRGSAFARTSAPLRIRRPSSNHLRKSFLSRGAGSAWGRDLFKDVVGSAVRSFGIETGTKLYISNLDYGVSNEDIRELFSEVGVLKHCDIHYDRSGRSKGTAEVVYLRGQNAVVAMKRYNNVQLDGKPLKIELIGTNLLSPINQAMNGAAALRRGRRPSAMTAGRGQRSGFRQSQGRGRGQGKKHLVGEKNIVTAEELNAELEKYHQDSMQTS